MQPGHILPLRARPGGVLERAGHTEAAVGLALTLGSRAGKKALLVRARTADALGDVFHAAFGPGKSHALDAP